MKKGNEKTKIQMVVPKDKNEAAKLLGEVGKAERIFEKKKRQIEEKISAQQNKLQEDIALHEEFMKHSVKVLYIYFIKDYKELTRGGKSKSVSFVTGIIGKRISPYKVELGKKEKNIIKDLYVSGLDIFVREVPEINKKAMLETEGSRKLAAGVKGIKIVQTEQFYVKPSKLKGITSEIKVLKKRIK